MRLDLARWWQWLLWFWFAVMATASGAVYGQAATQQAQAATQQVQAATQRVQARLDQETAAWLPDGVAPEVLQRVLARYRYEPTVDQVVAWVLERSARNASRVSSLARRARQRGWVPRVSLQVRHGQALDWADTEQADTSTRLRVSTDRDLTLSAALVFDLPRLLFAPPEIALHRLQSQHQAAAQRVLPEVIAWYFERRKLQVLRDLGLRTPLEVALRIAELQALLDTATDAAFSSSLAQPSR